MMTQNDIIFFSQVTSLLQPSCQSIIVRYNPLLLYCPRLVNNRLNDRIYIERRQLQPPHVVCGQTLHYTRQTIFMYIQFLSTEGTFRTRRTHAISQLLLAFEVKRVPTCSHCDRFVKHRTHTYGTFFIVTVSYLNDAPFLLL